MTTPKYFQHFPNLNYATKANKAGPYAYIQVKDFFRYMEVRSDIFREDTIYEKYFVKNGQRPDQISYELYGDEQYYWTILQVNEIYDYFNQWPLSSFDLENFTRKKYGGDAGAGKVRHYITQRVKDNLDHVILESGQIVPEDFIFTYVPDPTQPDVRLTSLPTSISNRQHEEDLNESKSSIFVVNKRYVYDYVREVKNYAKSLSESSSLI